MTIIAAYRDPSSAEIFIAADSLASSFGYRFQSPEKKLVEISEWIVGISGISRTRELLEALPTSPRSPSQLISEIRANLTAASFKEDPETRYGPPSYLQSFILARPGELYEVDDSGALSTPSWGFAAIGSGAPWAEGAAHQAISQRLPAEHIIRAAINAALTFRIDCGGVIDFRRLSPLSSLSSSESQS